MSSQTEANLLTERYIQNVQLPILKHWFKPQMSESAAVFVSLSVSMRMSISEEHREHLVYKWQGKIRACSHFLTVH